MLKQGRRQNVVVIKQGFTTVDEFNCDNESTLCLAIVDN